MGCTDSRGHSFQAHNGLCMTCGVTWEANAAAAYNMQAAMQNAYRPTTHLCAVCDEHEVIFENGTCQHCVNGFPEPRWLRFLRWLVR